MSNLGKYNYKNNLSQFCEEPYDLQNEKIAN